MGKDAGAAVCVAVSLGRVLLCGRGHGGVWRVCALKISEQLLQSKGSFAGFISWALIRIFAHISGATACGVATYHRYMYQLSKFQYSAIVHAADVDYVHSDRLSDTIVYTTRM